MLGERNLENEAWILDSEGTSPEQSQVEVGLLRNTALGVKH